MKKSSQLMAERRKFLKLVGGGAAFVSLAGLAACSDSGSETTAKATTAAQKADPVPDEKPAAQTAMKPEPASAEPVSQPATASSEGAPHLSEDFPQAKALGYYNDSSAVDAAKYPKHTPDQICGNCVLYTGKAGDAWGPCGIFPGHQVNANGWCTAYVRKA
ncbi:MAG: high-potential iron-sulfur protein [Xanthomonadales bacterium]|nr:high-potential iron-sulfur protein [Xanthomonadales bacterium]